MTTPVIRCIKQQLDCEVHMITKKSFAGIVQDNPYIDKLFLFENNMKALISSLKKEKYDRVIDLHNNLRSKRLSMALKVKTSRISKLSIHKEVLILTGISNLPDLHFSERGLDTVSDLGVKNDHEGMDFYISASAKSSEFLPKEPFVGLALATAHYTKNIPLDLIEFMIQKSTLPVVLMGGPKEKVIGESLVSKFPNKTINTAGLCSLQESSYLVSQAKYLIAGDTGLMHIAAALKKPTLSIWGATIPEFGVFPYYGKYDIPHFIHEVKLSCRPCSKHGSAKCPKKHFNCMNLQDKVGIAEHMHVLENIISIDEA